VRACFGRSSTRRGRGGGRRLCLCLRVWRNQSIDLPIVLPDRSPTSSTRRLTVKRIVGLGGDTIRTLPPYPQKLVTLEPGQVWVEGDNSDQSNDSNTYGPVPISLLHSKVSGIVYPFGRLCSLSSAGASATTAQAAINTPEGRIYTLPSAINVGVRMSAKAGRAPGSESIGFGGRDGLGEGERAVTEKQRTTDKLV
jgi:hypothetical protein